jgi:phosphoadenosine phosphosulfate reductase
VNAVPANVMANLSVSVPALSAAPAGNVAAALAEAAQRAELSAQLEPLTAEERVAWALANLPGPHVLSSSFGAQAAVMLHLVVSQAPQTPVVVVDTGYLFRETYQFIDTLQQRLNLNLQVARAELSAGWQEARFGRLWEQGLEGIETYNRMNKVEPMRRLFEQLGSRTWFTGLRRDQAESRSGVAFLGAQEGRFKVAPIADWSDRDVGMYLKRHGLPYHPLWDKGYVSVGDWHTTRSLAEAGSEEATRFFGLKRECGLHDPDYSI